MNPRVTAAVVFLFLASLLLSAGPACVASDRSDVDATYYAIEINGVLCGYARVKSSSIEENGREMRLLDERIFMKLEALGMNFDGDTHFVYHIDPQTGKFTYQKTDIKQGPTEVRSTVRVEGDTARFASTLMAGEKVVPLPPDVILETTFGSDFLFEDFRDGSLETKTYNIFEPREGEVQPTTFTREGSDTLNLGGREYHAIVLDGIAETTNLKIKWWIDADTGQILKFIPIADRVIYLADRSVVNKIGTADMDALILSKVDVTIADIPAITYMKVKAVIEPVGLIASAEGLNVPGQRFTGTVVENLIDGVFEIEHPRYDGEGAPPFPPDFGGDRSGEESSAESGGASLREFLEPQPFIESDDSVLAAKAREITEGSKDAWDAAKRLSAWVSENIAYAIPGGSTARKTYDIRAGECGAHSFLLAAFCRSVGIPARVVWGCMYTPQNGGSFGQHGWNEIYMGKAGWVPVDATATEIDFVDSGHIRIGVVRGRTISFNAHEMEILDYRVGSGDASASTAGDGSYDVYVGRYAGPKETLRVFLQDGHLALDVPGRMVLAFTDADEEGRFYYTMSNRLFLTFENEESSPAHTMFIHEVVDLRKTSDPEAIDADVPAEYAPYVGVYHLAALQADFEVIFRKGGLAVKDPLEKRTVKIRPTGDGERWIDEFDKNTIAFDTDADGNVVAMIIDSISKCRRE
ncbi:MAG: transglutaminase-like domain-containing protein [bacterium]